MTRSTDTFAPAPPRPDTNEMVVVHRVFRRLFGALPDLVRQVPAGDTTRAAVVADHYTEIASGLHHHHTNEDEYLWPMLLDRVRADQSLVLRMAEQHECVASLLERADDGFVRFRASADPELGTELAGTLDALSAALHEHLSDEERHVLPMVEEHLSIAEWEQLGERGRAGIPKDRLLIQLGYLLEGTSPAEQREFLAHLPLPVRVLWKVAGRRKYARERRLVEGS